MGNEIDLYDLKCLAECYLISVRSEDFLATQAKRKGELYETHLQKRDEFKRRLSKINSLIEIFTNRSAVPGNKFCLLKEAQGNDGNGIY